METESLSEENSVNKNASIEHQISDAVSSFEKEYMGRGPLEIQTFIVENMIRFA